MSQVIQKGRPVRPQARVRTALHFGLFVVPGMAIYLALVLVPMAMAIGTSTTNLNQFRPNFDFIGLANYVDLFQDAEFRQSLSNTTILAAIVTIVPCSVGLAVAVLLDKKGWVFNALRAGFFIPVVLSAVVVSVIWGVILTDEGLLNQVLISIGIVDPPGWLSDPDLALYTVASIICWQSLGVTIVIYLAGLQGIPRDLLEAAEIDGAGAIVRFRKITWPMLAPAFTINVILTMIGGFKAYDYIKVITNGGPGVGTTSTIAFDVVRTSIEGGHVGYGQAMATVMLALIAFVSIVVLRFLQRREVQL